MKKKKELIYGTTYWARRKSLPNKSALEKRSENTEALLDIKNSTAISTESAEKDPEALQFWEIAYKWPGN